MEPPLPHWLPDCRTREYCRGIQIQKPRYETNVYPIYYYWSHTKGVPHQQVYSRIVESFDTNPNTAPENSLIPHIQRIGDTEIDILIEDREYFVFVEAKNVPEGKKAKFEKTGGVHQLVRQYLQGKASGEDDLKDVCSRDDWCKRRAGCGK